MNLYVHSGTFKTANGISGTSNDAEILRLLVLALSMMEKRGFSHADAMKHVYVVSSGDYLCFVLRRTAFTPTESREMHRVMVEQGFQPALAGPADSAVADSLTSAAMLAVLRTSWPSVVSLATLARDMTANPSPVATSPLSASGLPSSITTCSESGGRPAFCR